MTNEAALASYKSLKEEDHKCNPNFKLVSTHPHQSVVQSRGKENQ